MGSGFLAPRGSFMLDTVAVAMVLVTALLLVSVSAVRFYRNHRLHRRMQIFLALLLLVTIAGFELELRFFTDWRALAAPSPYYPDGTVWKLLMVHLAFAIPTPLVWAFVVWHALRNYRDGFSDPRTRQLHRWGGRSGTVLMCLTAVTGWLFYWAAFVA